VETSNQTQDQQKKTQSTVVDCVSTQSHRTVECGGVCGDGCNIWHHKSCIELCSQDYELLEKSNVQWICCKCESINISTFTFRRYKLETSNIYEQITGIDLTLDTIPPVFSPLKTSSPKTRETSNIPNSESTFNSRRSHHLSSNPYEVQAMKNLRIMTVNCRSIRDKQQEFKTALHYLKPDVVCATEPWLK